MKHIVWVKYSERTPACYKDGTPDGVWVPNGDGPMGPKTAERVAREIQQGCPGVKALALPANQQPT